MKKFTAFLLTALLLSTMVLAAFPMEAFAAPVPTLSPANVKLFFEASKNSVTDTFTSSKGTKLPYRLYVPSDYDPNQSYPLVLFLHGAGEAGNNNNHIFSGGSILQRLLTTADRKNHPCLILAPQCGHTNTGGKWVNSDWGPGFYDHTKFTISPYMVAAEELLDKVIADYSVDETSLYVSGISMGGYGTWDIISRNPDKFAAAIPVCGGIDESYMEALKGMPIRTFHCKNDPIVSSAGTIKANSLLKDHGDFLYTEYNSAAHDAWTQAYMTEGLTDWLFAQHTEPKKAEATYTADDGVTLSGAANVDKGADLSFTYTVKDGYVLDSLTLNGNKIDFENNKTGTITLPSFEGGEIKAVTKKTHKVTVDADASMGDVTAPETVVDGEKLEFTVNGKDGCVAVSVKVNGTEVEKKDGKYIVESVTSDVTVSVTFDKPLAEDTNIPEPPENTDSDKTQGPNVVVIGVLAAVALIIIGGAAFIIIKKRK